MIAISLSAKELFEPIYRSCVELIALAQVVGVNNRLRHISDKSQAKKKARTFALAFFSLDPLHNRYGMKVLVPRL